jgi:DNA-binding response OmpR family regulator
VIISADATPGQVQRLLEIGATDYLTKPFDIEKLLRMLDENLSTQQGAINVVGSEGSPHRPTEILQ